MNVIRIKWLKRLGQTKAFLGGGVVLLIVGGLAYGAYISSVENACLVRHNIVMNCLREHVKSGREIPKSLTELTELEYISGNQKLKYYPDAWSKPGRIFLKSPGVGSYIVTFGDGARTVLNYYDNSTRTQGYETNSNEITYRLQSKTIFGTLPMLFLLIFLLLAFSAIFIIERIVKKDLEK